MKNSPEPRKKQKVAAMLWCAQVDAAAKVEAEVDGGGGAPRLATRGRRRRHEGEKRNDPSVLFIRRKNMCQARQSRGHETELLPRFPQIY